MLSKVVTFKSRPKIQDNLLAVISFTAMETTADGTNDKAQISASYYSATATVVKQVDEAEVRWLEEEEKEYQRRSVKSLEMMQRASSVLPSGVASCYHRAPTPFFVNPEESKGGVVVDLDGNEYIDFHSGYGVTCLGHQHPQLIAAWSRIVSSSASISGVCSPDATYLGEKLASRFQQPYWRFMNSGTEATLDAIRLARGYKGRKYIIKPEASYHGHHDAVWVSVDPVVEEGREEVPSVPYCQGIPSEVYELTRVVEFNNIDSLKYVLNKYPGEIAGIIMEPILCNCGIIKAKEDYMREVFALSEEHDFVVIFDLVKLGVNTLNSHLSVYPKPHMVTLGKALGGGYPIGALGMSETFKDLVENRVVMLAGTFNGGSYAMKIASAVLDIMSPEEQARIETMSNTLATRLRDIISQYHLPAYIETIGNKGCIFVQNDVQEVTNYREFAGRSNRMLEQILPVYFQNRGVWIQWKDEWTINVQHTQEQIDKFVDTFRAFADNWKKIHA